jgi:hypothetical protein
LPNTASELANTTVGDVPSARQACSKRARGINIAAHAKVEVGFAFAADGGGQVEHERIVGAHHLRCCIALLSRSWLRSPTTARTLESAVSVVCGATRSTRVTVLNGLGRAACKGKLSLRKQLAGEPRAQETGAAGDDDVHCLLSP